MKQSYFDLGIDLEKAYAKIDLARKESRLYSLEELEKLTDSIHADTGLDMNYTDEIWHELISAHQWFKEVPRLKQQIKNAEEEWKKSISRPIKTYEEHMEEKFEKNKEAWLKLAKPEALEKLNKTVNEYNSLTPEQREKKWLQYRNKTEQIIYNKTPSFIKARGCINCEVSKRMQEKNGKPYGVDHEILSGCVLQGCKNYGHDLTNPFIDPEEAMQKAIETKDVKAIENARQYILSVKENYECFFEEIGVSLDTIISGQTSQPKEQT